MFAMTPKKLMQQLRESLISVGEKTFDKQNIVPSGNGFYVRSNVSDACILISINAGAVVDPDNGTIYEILSLNPKTNEKTVINGADKLDEALKMLSQYQNDADVESLNSAPTPF